MPCREALACGQHESRPHRLHQLLSGLRGDRPGARAPRGRARDRHAVRAQRPARGGGAGRERGERGRIRPQCARLRPAAGPGDLVRRAGAQRRPVLAPPGGAARRSDRAAERVVADVGASPRTVVHGRLARAAAVCASAGRGHGLRRARRAAARCRAGDRGSRTAPGRAARLPAPLRPGRGVEALDRPAVRVRGVGGPPRGRARRRTRDPSRLAGIARLGARASWPPRRGRRARVPRAARDGRRVFHRPRLCPQLQASSGPDRLLPPARRPRARARRVAPVPAGGLSVIDRTSTQFRAALELYDRASLLELGALADAARWKLHPENVVTYNIDRNINYTNVCVADCKFCAFYRRPKHDEGYVLSFEQIGRKIDELRALGGVQILIQGGHNPYIPFQWYLDLMRYIKRHHPIHIHGFSPSEIDFFAGRFGMTLEEVIRELVAAGLDSVPGGGGEILVQEVRDRVAKKKAGADRWLEVMETAHRLGLKTSVTMMYGLGETTADRIEHLFRVKQVQARTGGFTAFICWPLQPEHTELAHFEKTDAVTYLRTQAIARIVLDNVPNIQASWVTMGPKIGQVALRFGANDFGSLMMEENVVSAAGTTWRMTLPEMQRLIADAGYVPRQRRQDYSVIEEAA